MTMTEAKAASGRSLLLPTVEELIEALNRLHEAQRTGDREAAQAVEERIRSMAGPGLYEGYVGDDLQQSLCQVLCVERRGTGANLQTFWLRVREIQKFGGDPTHGEIYIELSEFLGDVRRHLHPRCAGSLHTGRRFWRL